MLFRNILLFVGMALAIPVEKSPLPANTTEVETVVPPPSEEVDISNFDTVVLVDENSGDKVEVLTAEVDLAPVLEVDPAEKPVIPENEKLDVDTSVCSKDILLMGNKVDDNSACKDIYKACTQKELLSIILTYYERSGPVSIEYVINDGINKGSVTENCGNMLVNSKIFYQDTTIIEPAAEVPPVEKVTKLTQDLPKEDIPNVDLQETINAPAKDSFAGEGEDEIKDTTIA
ncbi:hypothetical protein PIROE2DRAFT_67902 [Piromyces sp. E2]|nr:hypothetical protein PIROE2DRAFT_67902 [Piromyces sp. E2]|eukprot:OUM56498.1 hypothetical protein PIROE2DRAFT_67902 [Piromyces sp. E2]